MKMTKQQLEEFVATLDDNAVVCAMIYEKTELEYLEEQIGDADWIKAIESKTVRDAINEADKILMDGFCSAIYEQAAQ